jgi:hypothetical protein
MYVVQREIGPTIYTKIIIELPMPLYYKIIKPQNITMKISSRYKATIIISK